MIKVIARSIAKSNCTTELIEAIQGLAVESRKELGCLDYTIYQHIEDLSSIIIIETWSDQNALDNHKQTAHVKKIVPIMNEYRIGPPEVNIYKPL